MSEYFEEFFDGHAFDFQVEKQKVIDNLNWLKSLSVEEFTFYKKWEEIQEYGDLIGDSKQVKAQLWSPSNIDDPVQTIKEIETLSPRVVYVDTPELQKSWLNLRVFCHSADYNQVPGRYRKFLIMDGDRYLGFLAVGSDIIATDARDSWIGWNKETREGGKLTFSAVGSTIAPTQPLGYNFLGGKLCALLVTSQVVRDNWKKSYGNTLTGMTTTSLYGSLSQYNNLKWWHKCGHSKGKVLIKPDQRFYKIWHDWLKTNRSEEYIKAMTQKEGVSGPVTGAKLRVLDMICDVVGIKVSDYQHGYSRGIFYSCFYNNTKEFLRGEIKENDLIIKDIMNEECMLSWWKNKAVERYKKLILEKRIKIEKLFYNKMFGMKYTKAKEIYFSEVGR